MAVYVSTLSNAMEAMQAAIEALDATPYQRDSSGLVVDSFQRAVQPFQAPEQDATPHLEFVLVPEVSEVDDLSRARQGVAMKCRTGIDVAVRYEIRASSQDQDLKLAVDCGLAVMRAICAESGYLRDLGRAVPRQRLALQPVDEMLAVDVIVGITLIHEELL